MIGQTEQIKRDPSSLECDEQMFLNDWTKPTCEASEDEAVDSGRSSVSSTSSCHDITFNTGMNGASYGGVYETYTDLSNVHQYPYFNQNNTDGDISSWKDKHPCLWTSQDVIVWLFHLNQDPKLPTKMNNKDLEVTAFSSLTGADLVQMRCDEYLKCDPANAMFIYLKLQEELNRHQHMKNLEFSAPTLEQESPINYTNTKPTTENQSFKINSMDLRHLSFDNNEMFSSIRSLKNEPETPTIPTSAAPPNYAPTFQHSPQQTSPIRPTDTPSPASPYSHTATPPFTPPYSPPYSAAGSPPMMCSPQVAADRMAAENMMNEARFYQYYAQQPGSVMNQQLGFNMTEIKGNHLWEFVRDLLLDNRYNPSIIRWEDREKGIFRFVRSDRVAQLWGLRKNNPAMTYEKLSRAMRYYYQRKILERIDGKRLVYKFGTAATGWKP